MDTSEDTVITLKSKPLLVRFEPSLLKEVERQAKREGISSAAVVRMAVRLFLDPKAKR